MIDDDVMVKARIYVVSLLDFITVMVNKDEYILIL